jgi:hypothetical protein
MPDRRFFLLGVLALAAGPAIAQSQLQAQQAPLALVRRFYAPGFDERSLPMSKALRKLFLAAKARSDRDEEPVAGLDFAWTLGAQDAEDGWEKTLVFKAVAQTLGNAIVEVRFRNGAPQVLQYRVVKEEGRWVIDEIDYLTAKEKLSKLFEKGARGES